MNSWIVPASQRAIRLDAFVRRCLPHLSLREAQRAIDERVFWVHERPGRKGDRLFGGDVISFKGPQHLLAPTPLPGWDLQVPIRYEDDFVMVVDKPAGMATHGFSGRERKSLANFLTAIRPSLARVGKSPWEPGLVHRLDRDTSGLVLVAKEQESFENLRGQFRRGLIKKKYWALVWGKVKSEQVLAYPLIRDPSDRKKMRVVKDETGERIQARRWKASTQIKVVVCARTFSFLEVEIDTGVTHQIRVHLEAFGYPLVGDPLYGGSRPDPFSLGRQFLHAYCLGFHHPKTGEELIVESPLPEELRRVLDGLKLKP